MPEPTPDGGFLLAASPALIDPNFHRTVVLIVNHDLAGSFGLVLNRPLDRSLADVLEAPHPQAVSVPLFQGGPVQTDMVQFVSSREGCGKLVVPGVAVGAGLDDVGEGDGTLRAYVGYAGWGAGQLEQETKEGSWIVAPAEARHVFDLPADRLWGQVLRELGGEYLWMALEDGSPSDK